MPNNFPEQWESRVRKLLTTQDVAPWLDGIPELETEVLEVGSGTASEQNIIHIAIENFNPDVLINNNTYPIDVQAHTDGSATVTLDKYQTKATSITDDAANGSSYDKIDSATAGHRRQIAVSKNKKAIHSLAPQSNTANTPIVTIANNKVYDAIVDLGQAFTDADFPMENRRLVLCSAHVAVLQKDRDRFANLLVDHTTGKLNQTIAGFEIYTYLGMPLYTSAGAKKAYGAAKVAGDVFGSVAFCVNNVAKKTGYTKQYFGDSKADPINQRNLLNYRHYFLATPVEAKYIGAII